MRSQHPFGGRGCSYRSLGGGGWCAPSVHSSCACALSILLGEGVARTGLLGGRGVWCAPSVHWCCACAIGILLGEGVARTGLLGEGADAPPASTDVAHAPSASFWREGVLLMCGERNPIKGGVSSILFLSCSAIILLTQIILQVCGDLWTCDISLVKHSEFLWTFFKTKVHVIIRTHISVWPQLNFNA